MNTKSMLCMFIIVSSTLMMSPIPIKAQTRPSIYVSPANTTFNETSTDFEFNVTIMTANWTAPGVFAYQFMLAYNYEVLEAIAAEIPTNHWLKPTIKPSNIFTADSGTINKTRGFVSFAATLIAPELGKTGGGTLATVTMKIIAAPTNGSLASTIYLSDVIMVAFGGTPIPKANYDIITAGVVVVPEFPSFLILSIFLIVTMMAIVIFRKKANIDDEKHTKILRTQMTTCIANIIARALYLILSNKCCSKIDRSIRFSFFGAFLPKLL